MKLYRFRGDTGGKSFMAMTRDKAGKALKRQISVTIDNDIGQPEKFNLEGVKWMYIGPFSSVLTPKIQQQLQRDGIFIGVLQISGPVYVFDVNFDWANTRIYIFDEDLGRFKQSFKNFELTPQGQHQGYYELEYAGKIENKYNYQLEAMGIDVNELTTHGFSIQVTSETNKNENLRRFIERNVRKKLPALAAEKGIIIEGFHIDTITPKKEEKQISLNPPRN